MLNNEKCTEFLIEIRAITFGSLPWALRSGLELRLQRKARSELRRRRFLRVRRAACVIAARQCADGSFLVMRSTNPYVDSIRRNQFRWFVVNEDSYLSEAVKVPHRIHRNG